MPKSDLVKDVEDAIEAAKREMLASFFKAPNDFFTEVDLTSLFAHRLYLALEDKGLPQLVHLQYPTPFRCSMSARVFEAKTENQLTAGSRKFRRGFFDLTVLHPGFSTEFAHDFRISKGQTWSVLSHVLAKRNADSDPAALAVFELMYLRDPVWGDQSLERGAKTMEKIAIEAKLDFDKARHALKETSTGFRFAVDARMMLFDNGLNAGAALALKEMLDPEIEFYSAALGPLQGDANDDQRCWADVEEPPRASAAKLKATDIPEDAGVYAWFRDGTRVYVGTAASLRARVFKDHLGNGKSLKGSALRRNVAEHLGFATAAALKSGIAKLTDTQHAQVRTWLMGCEVAWMTCDSAAKALGLEKRLKAEHMPTLTKK